MTLTIDNKIQWRKKPKKPTQPTNAIYDFFYGRFEAFEDQVPSDKDEKNKEATRKIEKDFKNETLCNHSEIFI